MSAEQLHTETETGEAARPTLYRRLATSQGRFARLLRWGYRSVNRFSVPAPKIVAKPMLWIFLLLRTIYYFAIRVFVCEPLFKARCTKYGHNLHTGPHIHFILGKGDIVVGDNVRMGGKIDILFAARFSNHPTLEIGDNTGIGHGCMFTIGKRISIGNNCRLSGDITIMDSSGHGSDMALRLAGRPPESDDVRPVVIRDGVWIGKLCIIFPGVKIGEGCVVSAGSVVRTHMPPYSVVAGNPAKVMFRLKRPNVEAGA